ncbi:MAG: calcium-binding protein, partial [Burkholderiaceae bacterium]
MTTNTIHNAFVNALLADASYVDGLFAGQNLANDPELQTRLTPDLAKYLSDNFEIVTQKLTSDLTDSGFDATVWREKSTGQIYVSMRGTEFSGYADLASDIDLTFSGLARDQVVSMVNWWLKSTAPTNALAAQIKVVTPFDFALLLAGHSVGSFAAAAPVLGDNTIPGANSVNVNGHSLGGHLATAFSRIFGSSLVSHTYTFNSATFNPLSPEKFEQIAAALGTGTSAFPTAAQDTNFFAQNGADVTTQNITGGQIGFRIKLFNEESPVIDLASLPNHYMYKLTDALALGNALVKLDTTLTIDKLTTFLEAGSDKTIESIEKLFDGLRKALAGPNVQALPFSDAGDSPEPRVTYHATLAALQINPIFTQLAGKLKIELASNTLGATARTDFGAFIALQDLSPLYISGTDEAAQALLKSIWKISRAEDYTAWEADQEPAIPTPVSDSWIADRAA